MKREKLRIIVEPCTKSITELLDEFRNMDKSELYKTFGKLRKISNQINLKTLKD